MKERFQEMFKDKLFLVMLVLGLLTIVAAAGVVTIQRGNSAKEGPYLNESQQENLLAEETLPAPGGQTAGESDALTDTQNTQKIAQADSGGPGADLEGDGSLSGGKQNAGGQMASGGTQIADAASVENQDSYAAPAGTGRGAATPLLLNFGDTSKMTWPVEGNILLDYSMDTTIYHPTLEQYQCNPGIVIQSEVSTPIYAPANARVVETGFNEEIGNYVKLDLGNDYEAVCGQLKEVAVTANEYLEQGKLLGYVAEPTKYYSVEGSNVYFELDQAEKAVDPLDYLE